MFRLVVLPCFYLCRSNSFHVDPKIYVHRYQRVLRNAGKTFVVFAKNASFRSYGHFLALDAINYI